MPKKKKPQKWTDVYPVGTKAGNEECKLFKVLSRNTKYDWRSTSAISKESGLPRERVEEILDKYLEKGMIFQSPKNPDLWGYWERVPEMLEDEDKNMAQTDHEKRIDRALGGTFTWGTGKCVAGDIKLFTDSGIRVNEICSTPSKTSNKYAEMWSCLIQIADLGDTEL